MTLKKITGEVKKNKLTLKLLAFGLGLAAVAVIFMHNGGTFTPVPTAYADSDCVDNATVTVLTALPATMTPGQVATTTVRVTNTGNTSWYNGFVYQFTQRSGLSISPVQGWLPYVMPAGSTVDWSFNVTAPAAPGVYVLQMQMIHFAGNDYIKTAGGTCPPPASDSSFGTYHMQGFTVPAGPSPTCSGMTSPITWMVGNTGNWTVSATGVANATTVTIYGWSEAGSGPYGQGDLQAYNATNAGGGTWTVTVPYSNHPDLGTIDFQAYMAAPGYAMVYCGTYSITRYNSGTINVTSNVASNWSLGCPIFNPAASFSSASNITSGTYTSKPSCNWTLVPANLPGYSYSITPSATQTLP